MSGVPWFFLSLRSFYLFSRLSRLCPTSALHPDNMECLRYLVVLCKDLGRRYDAYETKLTRLERAAAQSAAAAGALTRVGSGGDGYDDGGAGDQQMYAQGYGAGSGGQQYGGPGGGGYSGGDEPAGAMDDGAGRGGGGDHAYGSSADRFAAPTMAGHIASPSGGGGRAREDETFADADLSDLLAD